MWMIDHGAKNLIFANRSGLSSQEAKDTVKALESKGAATAVYRCDVSKPEAVAELIAESSKRMPPIRGIIQAAMVLRVRFSVHIVLLKCVDNGANKSPKQKDGLLENMTHADYTAVTRPKVHGTWNLHNQLPKDMDFFIMLSSISGIIGNATQASYAAGSTFLDAFAAYRNKLGLPAVTIDLGVITGVGYLATKDNKELAEGMRRQGFEGTDEARLLALVQSAIANPRRQKGSELQSQVITGLGTWRRDDEGGSIAAFESPVFSHFRRRAVRAAGDAGAGAGPGARVRDALKAARTLDEAADVICTALVDRISSRSNLAVENISREKPMTDYGIDSLVAVEMRNWIVREMDSTVPILELLANQGLQQLSATIAQRSRLVNLEATAGEPE